MTVLNTGPGWVGVLASASAAAPGMAPLANNRTRAKDAVNLRVNMDAPHRESRTTPILTMRSPALSSHDFLPKSEVLTTIEHPFEHG
ncbi:hypothetical protein [Nonomuraea deserti]|uniref:hypothetical protein n=1 Tax=Nonomuraea deserti TaxID=1848322 RepID=UPI001FEA7AE9|nr:hypothetical protein [Nonomuraea deserti]